jgi:hypothetical protein
MHLGATLRFVGHYRASCEDQVAIAYRLSAGAELSSNVEDHHSVTGPDCKGKLKASG